MSRVLVTGASGFIGSRVLPGCLHAGHEVHAVARELPQGRSEVHWHRADLLDSAATVALVQSVRPDLLVHLAWYAEHGSFWSSPENVRWVEASLALIRAFAAAGGRRAAIAGTCAEYDWSAIGHEGPEGHTPARCDELRTPLNPRTLYGASKYAVNLVAGRFAQTVDLELACGRVFFLYGPGEQAGRLVAAVARSLLAGEPTPTTDGRQIRDFSHVQDVADGFVALLHSDVQGPVNIASGQPVTVGDLVETIARLVGRPELLRRGAIARAAGDPEALLADVRRLGEEVGFTPRVDFEDGLAAT
ncbi:MAG TPA: NAD(P)-dependent oxidoreductase, partial [Solirubrobacteraceae bacterium]|nr:NAD(P)-dependent oxidoreductase [Solirubrobacteraceae bacterium]